MLSLELDVPCMSVSGFPCLVALELQNGPSAIPRVGLPSLTCFGPALLLGLRWTDRDKTLAQVGSLDPSVGEAPLWEPSFRLLSGQSRRQLVDLDLILTPAPSGHGRLTIDYRGAGCSASCMLGVAEPSDADRRVLARRRSGTHWLACLIRDPLHEDELAQLSMPAREALALYLAWAAVVRAPSLAKLPASLFAGLPPGLAPEAACFDYELARAREDPRAPELRRHVEQRWPAMCWCLDAVDRGGGTLAFVRDVFGPLG